MTDTYDRRPIELRPNAAWRQFAPRSGHAPAEPNRRPTAFGFSLAEPLAETVRATLGNLHVATIVRSFDGDAADIVTAAAPDIVLLACNPTDLADLERIRSLARLGPWLLLVFDTGERSKAMAAALDAGADVVLGPDADLPIVRATLRALVRRTGKTEPPEPKGEDLQKVVGDLTVDEDTFEVRDDGELVALTPTEFKVVADLALHAGLVRSPSQLMSALRGYPVSAPEARQAIATSMRRIRNKLAGCQHPSVKITSYRGRGYRLEPASREPDLRSLVSARSK